MRNVVSDILGTDHVNLMVQLKGLSPTLMHSSRLANEMDPLVRELKSLTAKRGKDKTEEVLRKIADLEFEGGLYYDELLGPYWPAANILRCWEKSAYRIRKGPKVNTGVFIPQARCPLVYSGPRKLDALLKDPAFRDYRPVGVNKGSTVYRTRPMFRDWSLDIETFLDISELDYDVFCSIVKGGGQFVGLSDGCKNRYNGNGLYEVTITKLK